MSTRVYLADTATTVALVHTLADPLLVAARVTGLPLSDLSLAPRAARYYTCQERTVTYTADAYSHVLEDR